MVAGDGAKGLGQVLWKKAEDLVSGVLVFSVRWLIIRVRVSCTLGFRECLLSSTSVFGVPYPTSQPTLLDTFAPLGAQFSGSAAFGHLLFPYLVSSPGQRLCAREPFAPQHPLAAPLPDPQHR